MEIEVDITKKDFYDFNKYFHFKKNFKKKIFLGLITALILSTIFNILRPFLFSTFLIEFLIFAIFINMIIFLSTYLNIYLLSKKLSNIGSTFGKRKYLISQEGFKEISKTNTNFHKWSGIISIEQNNNSIFIFVEFYLAYIVPKRFFKDELHMSEFNNLINSCFIKEERK